MIRKALLLAFTLLGCQGARTDRAGGDALALLAATPAFAGALQAARPLVRDGAVFRSRGAISLELSGQTMRLSDATVPGAFLELAPEGLAAVAPTQDARGLVFADAFAGGDVAVLASPSFVEEARILRKAAPHVARYRAALGPAIASLRAREGRIEAIDEAGKVLLGTAPVFAVDAKGTRLELSPQVRLDGRSAEIEIALDPTGLVAPIVLDPIWSTVSPIGKARISAAMTLLADGKVLVAGGYEGGSTLTRSAEVYDPALNTWTTVGSMVTERSNFGLVRLASGRVLTAGPSPELYDPGTKTWSATSVPSYVGTVGFLAKTGKAVTFFHYGDSPYAMAFTRLYDESTNTWSDGKPLPTPRGGTNVEQLADGRILVVGGYDSNKGTGYSLADLYDPSTDTWTSTAPRPVRAAYAASTTLASGKVLIVGGQIPLAGGTPTAHLFDPASASWSRVDDLRADGVGLAAAGLGRALVLPTSWSTIAPTFVFDEATGKFLPTEASPAYSSAAIALGGGKVLEAGGQTATGAVVTTTSIWQGAALGAACATTKPGDCASLFCADGICCNKACTGACEQCGTGGTCNALSGAPHAGRSCAPYATCAAGSCATGCTTDADCVSTGYCSGMTCVPRKAIGATCGATRECGAGATCVDSVCCSTACGGQCEACDIPGREGTCSAVVGAPRGARTACADFDKECGKVCDGKTRATCVYLPTGSRPCGKNGCADGKETHANTCDDKGLCQDTPRLCGAYACGLASCLTACATAADCSPGNVCSLGACVPAKGLGGPCTKSDECSTGFCTDGVCCALGSCGAGATCAAPEKKGTCSKLAGVACTSATECASEKCVDGVCCDSDCTGQCEACNVPGLAGKCSPAKGAPRGARAACAVGAGPCDGRSCDGKDVTTCSALAGAEVGCREPSCKDGVAIAPAACDGAGKCPTAAEKSCGGFACDAEGLGCRETCSADDHCATGFHCKSGSCRPVTATCSGDFASRIDPSGASTSCAPFLCRAGECPTTCGSSSDCVAGTACANGACVAPPASDDGGGCSHAGRGGAAAPLALLSLALLLAYRRRSPLLLLLLGALGCSTRAASTEGGEGREGREGDDRPADVARATQRLTMSGATSSAYRSPLGVGIVGGDVLLLDYVGTHREHWRSTGTWKDVSTSKYFAGVGTVAGQAFVISTSDTTPGAEKVVTELFDPSTGAWVPKASPPVAHMFPWVTPVGVGKLMVGNSQTSSGACLTSVSVFTPATNNWTAAAPTSIGRCGAAAMTLADGKVMVASGANTAGFVNSAELYDPGTNTWSAAGTLDGFLQYPRGTLAGGKPFVAANAFYLYEATTKTWTLLSGRSRSQPGIAPLPSGRVLVVGGSDDDSIEVFDPVTKTFLPAGKSAFVRRETTAIAATDGRVLIVGGSMTGVGSILEAEVFVEQANGAACVADGECSSAHCVDGRCCDKACGGACEACNVAGKLGQCSPVTGAPVVGHPSCAPASTCSAGACKTSCGADSECAPSAYCDGTSCKTRLAKGAACMRAAECAGGFCVDGVCCSSACKGQCESCGESTSKGDCVPVAGAPRGSRPVCGGGDAGCAPRCDGVSTGICTFPPSTTTCGSNACSSGVESHASFCDGVGRCNDIPKTCGAYACVGATCATGCSLNADCAVGFYCKTGACLPTPGLGQPCSATAPCLGALFCTEGVCCGEAECGAGRSCALPASKGSCAKVDGQKCIADAECGSRACVDGVCCESRCAGQCQACDQAGSIGKCVAITGAPHGTRLACAAPAGSPCEATTCDGSDGSRCAAFAGTGVRCREPSCSKGTAVEPASCNGAGVCGALVRTACAPYRCAGTGCATSCGSSADCADGYSCTGAACVKSTINCSDDGAALVDPEGKPTSCAPFLCRDAACIESCASSTDCAPGKVCDGSGRCVSPTPALEGGDDGGGCATGHVGANGTNAAWWLLALALGLRLRARLRPSGS